MKFKCQSCGKEWNAEDKDEDCPTCGSNKKVEADKPKPSPTPAPARRPR